MKAIKRGSELNLRAFGECLPFSLKVIGNRGFTLLEVMIAVSIIAIALVAIFGSQSRSLALATESHFNIVAPMLASGKLAELRAEEDVPVSDEGGFGDDFPGYRWEIEIDTARLENFGELETLEEPLQRVVLTVLWSESNFRYLTTFYGRWKS